MSNYVFLDFDGVLFDSLKEAYVLCKYAYDGTDLFASVVPKDYDLFYRYKFLVYNSWQYYYLMKLLPQGLSDEELIEAYKKELENRDIEAEQNFDKRFYSARQVLMEKHAYYWDRLETPFPFALLIKQKAEAGDIRPIIVSKKNKQAIIHRLNQAGVDIPAEDIFGREELLTYESKAQFINSYMNQNGIERAFFVDDNSNNLEPCNSYNNITPLLAGWGNIAIGEKGLTSYEIMEIIS